MNGLLSLIQHRKGPGSAVYRTIIKTFKTKLWKKNIDGWFDKNYSISTNKKIFPCTCLFSIWVIIPMSIWVIIPTSALSTPNLLITDHLLQVMANEATLLKPWKTYSYQNRIKFPINTWMVWKQVHCALNSLHLKCKASLLSTLGHKWCDHLP